LLQKQKAKLQQPYEHSKTSSSLPQISL